MNNVCSPVTGIFDGQFWGGNWIDSNPYANLYRLGTGYSYHTGCDLNLNKPTWNSDIGKPIYSVTDGEVTYSKLGGGSWGWLIVIKHTYQDQVFYARYAHVNHKAFSVPLVGEKVAAGQQIALVGTADGYYGNSGAHLHFDISPTDKLLKVPNYWPSMDIISLRMHFRNPRLFLQELLLDKGTVDSYISTDVLNIRQEPRITSVKLGQIPKGDKVYIQHTAQPVNGYLPLSGRDGWVYAYYLKQNG